MPKLYSFVCRTCGYRGDTQSNHTWLCPYCGDTMRRDYSTINFSRSFQPHFNHSVGKFVSSKQQFKDELSRAGEKAGSDYTYVEMNEAPGVTEEGLDATRSRRREIGIDQPTKKLFT